MANLFQIVQRLKQGESVYVIDDYDEIAICFTPDLEENVLFKPKGGETLHRRSLFNELIVESISGATEVSEEEFLHY